MSVVQKDQLNLQSIEILSLRESLHVEQQRYRQLWDDRETMVTRLHSQIRQLQQGRDDYYTKNQELQVETHTHLHTYSGLYIKAGVCRCGVCRSSGKSSNLYTETTKRLS